MIELEPMDIVEIRHKKGMTQEEFADFIGVYRTTLVRWERGQTKPEPIYVANLVLCRNTGRSVMQVLGEKEPKKITPRIYGARRRYGIAVSPELAP